MVFVPHKGPLFQYNESGKATSLLQPEVYRWLRFAIGKREYGIEDVSEERPWRCRVWQVNTSFAFFFHTRRQAMLFLLRWG
jgi:hypothetical protein